ncbi:MAG: hypothetical protein JXO22_07435 [Phycisphaerae bacterium]|nr:hypothetical protein [Phycisphaerae bacterium]
MLKAPANSVARHFPGGPTSARASRLCCVLGPVFCALVPLLAGCSPHLDPGFNPYSRCTGERTVLERADDAINQAGQALDNLDQRIENIMY